MTELRVVTISVAELEQLLEAVVRRTLEGVRAEWLDGEQAAELLGVKRGSLASRASGSGLRSSCPASPVRAASHKDAVALDHRAVTIKAHTVIEVALARAEYWRSADVRAVDRLSSLGLELRQRLLAMPAKPTLAQASEALGGGLACDNCGGESDVVIELGEEPDYESSTAQVCGACLTAALAAWRLLDDGETGQSE